MAYIPRNDRGDSLRRYLERRSCRADAEPAVEGRPLTTRRRTTLALMGGALVSLEYWVWTLVVPWLRQARVWQDTSHAAMVDAAVGFLISIAAVTLIIVVAATLFTEVDERGIHRPDWAGGEFIPWTSVTEVSTGASPEVLQVRAGGKKISLSLMLYCHPAQLVALIRRHVPADRLKNI